VVIATTDLATICVVATLGLPSAAHVKPRTAAQTYKIDFDPDIALT
jgi:hypothetical protein